ncbi:MarC family protein [Adhaeretor mobilis]|uniref:UPF0056 membrane protein n=1 Tax=Adhaeretor mobilis TaxID=1930276 RepID=A0A517MRS0_9BACT|nr:MarC family protein [Adhaeretor mobilis]QDS97564.1 inner membrane protein [Adhaeretor mobilis]
MQQHLQAVITVLSLVNPAVCAAMFATIESGQPRSAQLRDATKASLAVLLILLLAAIVGVQFLHQFGISLDAFKVSGGIVLSWMGFSMLNAKQESAPSSKTQALRSNPPLTPLIMFAASPGTITGVITIAADHSGSEFPWTAIVAVCAAIVVTWPLMLLAARGGQKGEQSFARQTASRFMGLIVLAMGVQFVLSGLKSFFDVTS